MDRASTGSELTAQRAGQLLAWLETERSSGRLYRVAEWAAAALLVAMLGLSLAILKGGGPSAPATLSPPMIAVLLVANLIPGIALMVLLARRLAMKRAARGGLGTGRLHTRLVALFSVIAVVPTLLVAVFASLLIQSGLEFWSSNRARGMLENTVQLARNTYQNEVDRVALETETMSHDVAGYLREVSIDDPRFAYALSHTQVFQRNLSEAIIFNVGPRGELLTLALVNPYDKQLEKVITPDKLAKLKGRKSVAINSADRVGALTRLDYGPSAYLYASRVFDPQLGEQLRRANGVLTDYQALIARSRTKQLQFNATLLAGSLLLVGLSIFFALQMADRLVRPVGQLVSAAGRIEEGDFSVRVPVERGSDEIATLAAAFNRMTGRLQAQTGALIAANDQLDTRRAFIEAVLSSVSAGVVALDTDRRILLTNRSAQALLQPGSEDPQGAAFRDISAELDEFLSGDQREANVEVQSDHGPRTLAVKRVRYEDGVVLTFDDITGQLADQRRAAWSDIAQRIAHEIKNPLTPIQLAAERLQRRYGKEVTTEPETFERLTATIVRQVADLRRMVDEFSSFARMPKPVFRVQNVHDIARAALFLHEVAHPDILFALEPQAGPLPMVCDRRQLGQALTNVVKNAVEAIEARRNRGEVNADGDRVSLAIAERPGELVIEVTDTGIGLPQDRERLTEPYMTTRVRGTGLGLAIVKKIVEEHWGEIAFLDRLGGGTRVRIAFDTARLEELAADPANEVARADDESNAEEEAG